jgi:hypothetical protein
VNQSATLSASGANTYTWSNLSNSASIVVSPTVNTTYSVNGTDANGCENSAMITQSVSACTAISETGISNNFFLYPNPTSGILYLQSDYAVIDLELYNALGQLLRSELKTSIKKVDLSDLNKGLYYIKIVSGNSTEIFKIIRE